MREITKFEFQVLWSEGVPENLKYIPRREAEHIYRRLKDLKLKVMKE